MDEKKLKLIPVREIQRTQKAVTVEWVIKGALKRGTLPAEKVSGETVDEPTLDAAVPYGVPWGEMTIKRFDGADLEKALHAADIWTAEEAMKSAAKVVGVLQELYCLHLGSLIEFAAKYKS